MKYIILVFALFLFSCSDAFEGELGLSTKSENPLCEINQRLEGEDRADRVDQVNRCGQCGDGYCEGAETASSCYNDCGRCGDSICSSPHESTATCNRDCGSRCGDGVCNGNETISSCNADCGQHLDSVRIHKVRSCRNNAGPCNSKLTRPEFHFWDRHKVAKDKQKLTFLGTVSEPTPTATKHLVFLSAGQQFHLDLIGEHGNWDGLTGQRVDWAKQYQRKTWSVNQPINGGSLATQLVENNVYDLDETFMALAFDARFNYNFSKSNKQEIENAYFDWLDSKIRRDKIESIFLAGHSRGGCLVLRLAKRFALKYPSTPLIVQGYDPVCNSDQDEMGVSWQRSENNPLFSSSSNRFSYKTNFFNYFPLFFNVRILNITSGAGILAESLGGIAQNIEDARPLCQDPDLVAGDGARRGIAGLLKDGKIENWYDEVWTTNNHMAVSAMTTEGWNHLHKSFDVLDITP